MSDVWYKDGLKFKCTECGKCCTGTPGFVWVLKDEIIAMAEFLRLSLDIFSEKYIRRIGSRYALKERMRGVDFDCIFLEGKRCAIYNSRPRQCKTFPWWPQNLKSKEAWQNVECEGISEDAPVVDLIKIRKHLKH